MKTIREIVEEWDKNPILINIDYLIKALEERENEIKEELEGYLDFVIKDKNAPYEYVQAFKDIKVVITKIFEGEK